MATRANIAWKLRSLLQKSAIVSDCVSSGVSNGNGVRSLIDDVVIKRLSVDSRDVGEGTCFVALAGDRVDGHGFIQEALDRGASVVIAEAGRLLGRFGACERLVDVYDSHEAIGRLAATFYGVDELQQQGRLKLVGVTGTNGKTTVVAILTSILRAAGFTTGSLGTIGFDLSDQAVDVASLTAGMTTPPPIELCSALADAARSGASHVAMEVSSHALDQRRCSGLEFSVGVFTNLTQDHFDYHRDMHEYAAAKRRLFTCLPAYATAVVNAEDDRAEFMAAQTKARVVRYSTASPSADCFSQNLRVCGEGSSFNAKFKDRRIAVTTSLIGAHNVSNILAAMSAARALGVDDKAICKGVAAASLVPGRLERVKTSAACDVLVDYAHTPDALECVLRVLRGLTKGRLFCVFGCGGNRDKTKRPLMGRAVAKLADVGVLTSDNPRFEDPNAIINDVLAGFDGTEGCKRIVEPNRRTAIFESIAQAGAEDVVLIAGKGHEDYQIVGGQRYSFDDRLVAKEAAAQSAKVPA